jgi:hypothetical protein
VSKNVPGNGDSTTIVSVGLNPVYATGFGAEIYYDTHFNEWEFPFNFRFIFGGQVMKLRSNEYVQADVASTAPGNERKTAILLEKSKRTSAPIWTFSSMIRKSLGLKKESSDEDHYLFFRYNYSWQHFTNRLPIPGRPDLFEERKLSNNFSQFQLGIDLVFDSFFK